MVDLVNGQYSSYYIQGTLRGAFPLVNMGVSENVVYPIVPNGFADHYIPMKHG